MTTTNTTMTTANNIIGSKYEATRHLNTTQVAALIRKDIRELVKSGEIPAAKYSVKKTGSALHRAIDVSIADLPFQVRRSPEERAEAENRPCIIGGKIHKGESQPWLTREAYALLLKLEAVVASYNYDKCDLMTDYYNVRFYGSVDFA